MSLPDSFLKMVAGFGFTLEGEASYEDDGMMVTVQTHSLVKGAEKFVATAALWPNEFQRLSVKRFKSEQFKEALWVEAEADIKAASKRLEKLIFGSIK
jgi:hypothetical protein